LRYALPLLAALLLAACSPGGSGAADPAKPSEDPKFAGLDAQILNWRADIQKTNPICKAGGCVDYDVACKAEQTMTAEDTAKSATAKVVVAITFSSKSDPNAKPGSAFADFTKTPAGWTRTDAKPVNLSSCAEF
jgi:hypothetical protein